ncbi:glycosyl transferase [Streptomyces sp. NHF165]|nr:glycosyl transferase [Streptomyces sp. NHF165]
MCSAQVLPSAGDVPSVYGAPRAGGVPSGEEGPSACEALSGRGQQGAGRGFLAGEAPSAQEPHPAGDVSSAEAGPSGRKPPSGQTAAAGRQGPLAHEASRGRAVAARNEKAEARAQAEAPRVLVLRALGLGDLLTAVPALRALRRAHPGHELVLAAPAWLADAVRATGCADRHLHLGGPGRDVPAHIPWPWPAPRLAVDLHGDGPLSRAPLAALAPARLIACAPGPDAPPGTGTPDPEHARTHERVRWCRLLARHGIPADPGDLRIRAPVRPSPAPGAVVVHPGADAAARRWPADRFAEVARALTARHERVVLTHGPGERALAARVAARAGLPDDALPADPAGLPFDDLAALVAGARAVLVGDTGIAHLASALGTPSVVLFGPVAPALWGPPPHARHRALWRPGPGDGLRPGDPHGTRPDARLLRLTVADVLDACAALPPPTHRPGPGGAAPAPAPVPTPVPEPPGPG